MVCALLGIYALNVSKLLRYVADLPVFLGKVESGLHWLKMLFVAWFWKCLICLSLSRSLHTPWSVFVFHCWSEPLQSDRGWIIFPPAYLCAEICTKWTAPGPGRLVFAFAEHTWRIIAIIFDLRKWDRRYLECLSSKQELTALSFIVFIGEHALFLLFLSLLRAPVN